MRYLPAIIIGLATIFSFKSNHELRSVISLNGEWSIAESISQTLPTFFGRQVQVPGLVDQAIPTFDSIGMKSTKRNYFFYRRYFVINQTVPKVALLKLNKAMYGTTVYLNGKEVGSNNFNFTPSFINVTQYLNSSAKQNELIIRVGASPETQSDSVSKGFDTEKIRYIPGIYDDVSLVLSGYPFIENIQVAPDIKNNRIRIVAEIESDINVNQFCANYNIIESKSGKRVAKGNTSPVTLNANKKNILNFEVPIEDAKLWSPEHPFLYTLNLSTTNDEKQVRFGMRSFGFDPAQNCALLNGRRYAMLGTNVCFFRFCEDSLRANLPWDEKWVRKLYGKFKGMNWNSIRYCIGFPPEKWYEIADETGFLIQDEYPLWGQLKGLPTIREKILTEEYSRWMRERWNHPCVVIWDAQNETVTKETGKAIKKVRHFDLSNRPWDNGFAPPDTITDAIETHPYLLMKYHSPEVFPSKEGYLKDNFSKKREADFNDPNQFCPSPDGRYKNAVIINEYDWLWISRNGIPSCLSDAVFGKLFEKNLSMEELRLIRAENIAILTEYWRCHRTCAGILHFNGLGYSRNPPNNFTCDDFIDIKNLVFDPSFERIVKTTFLPICIMLNCWEKEYLPGKELTVPVYAINDLDKPFSKNIILSLQKNGEKIIEMRQTVNLSAFGQKVTNFNLRLPDTTGSYQLMATLEYKGNTIKSTRKIDIR